jgi:nitrogen fixation/metabolism regulation signal transduction histidine kinase
VRLRTVIRHPLTVVATVIGALSTLFAFALLAVAINTPDSIGQLFPFIVATSTVGLTILFSTISLSLYQLIRKFFAGESGARLHARFVGIFVSLALIPILIISLFTTQILQQQDRGEEEIVHALEGSRELYKTALNEKKKRIIENLYLLGANLSSAPRCMVELLLEEAREESKAMELVLYDINGVQIGFSSLLAEPELVPTPLDSLIVSQISKGLDYHKVQGHEVLEQILHVVIPLHNLSAEGGESRILSSLYTIPKRLKEGQQKINDAVMRNKKRLYLEDQRNTVHSIAFVLLLLLSLLTALWFAFYSTRRLIAPIHQLAKGTKSVAAGIYNQPITNISHDDLGFLVQSFNDMMLNLDHTHKNLKQSQSLIEHQNTRLEGILSHLSSGVMVLDPQRRLERANTMACTILDSRITPSPGIPIGVVAQHHPPILPLVDTIRSHIQQGFHEWSDSLTITTSRGVRHLFCRGSSLLEHGELEGYVVVFDDVTELVSAQRNAAWSEVARRLAHEIKNPLTPIQLSADRLRHRYLKKMDAEEGRVLDRATHTIIQQVDSLKRMVQAFSDYARAPKMQLALVQPAPLLEEVVELYRAQHPNHVQLQIEGRLQEVEADSDRLRQILNNLIKNGLEACGEEGVAEVVVSAKNEGATLQIKICDNGRGVDESLRSQIFEPYATTKPKGTGLGLAIVKRIIEEHNGNIELLESRQGSCFLLHLPSRHQGHNPNQLEMHLNDGENPQ